MKKYLLGAMMLVGAMAYGQGNRVIKPIDASGAATAIIPVEVTGEVFDPAQLSLVVELKSSQSADGTGFAFRMPNMWKGNTEKVVSTGAYAVTVEKNNERQVIDGTLTVQLKDGTTTAATITNKQAGGTADDVTLNYTLTGSMNTGKTQYDGALAVDATAGTKTGTFSDTSVQMIVDLSGQTVAR